MNLMKSSLQVYSNTITRGVAPAAGMDSWATLHPAASMPTLGCLPVWHAQPWGQASGVQQAQKVPGDDL